MVDPVSIVAAVAGSLQLVVQLKTYFDDRRRKRRQQQYGDQMHEHQITSFSPLPYNNYIQNNYYYPGAPHMYPGQYVLPGAPPMYPGQYVLPGTPPMHPGQYVLPGAPPMYPGQYVLPGAPPMYPGQYVLPGAPHMYPGQPLPPSAAPWPALPNTIISGSSAARSLGAASNYPADHHPHPHGAWLGARIDLVVPQEAPHNVGMLCHERLGMRTGGPVFNYNDGHALDHWNSLQRGCFAGSPGAIAVVDWTKGNIDMFVESHAVYFRTYRIYLSPRDVAVFADLYKENEVFSGEISHQKLARCNKDIKVLDNLGHLFHSTNSWRRLGVYDENVVDEYEYEEPIFIRLVRGAVFGLVCSLYESPCEINVDMDTVCYPNVVRITHMENSTLVKRENCCFSVFSFNTNGWATEDILVG